jgi:pyruvate/2-oxoglutarate dehydrogenase complex dihydrolipoamide acyltransferase (E2) component
MAVDVRLPLLGDVMTEGTLVEWLVADGATVKAGDVLYTLESEKTSQDIEAPSAGSIRQIGQVGEVYPVGELIATIE